MRRPLPWIAALLLLTPLAHADAKHPPRPRNPPKPASLTENQRILHALNRLAYGPRPGDLGRVKQMGLQRWIDQQLNPEKIDDSAVEAKLAKLPMLSYPPEDLAVAWAADQRRILKAIQEKRELQKPGAQTAAPPAAMAMNAQMAMVENRAEQLNLQQGASVQAVGELVDAKLLRSVESQRQLQEVLVDFWSNHFNVDVKKGPVRTYKVMDERDAIRPHVFGRFRDLLEASAKSPAMLFYLDNFRSTREMTATLLARRPGAKNRGGLNENYGRELMELHTLGVDGGYTQKDVQEVARCFTGWSIDRQGHFQFHPFAHDNGEKVVLGHTIPAGGGVQDGEAILDLLAHSPATAHHLAVELCTRFVSDEPSAALVNRVAAVYQRTDGDLREVYRAIFSSPEFWSPAAYRAKTKSPFEYAVFAVRALGGTVEIPDASEPAQRLRLVLDGGASVRPNGAKPGPRNRTLAVEIAAMGEPLYGCQPPTGYPEKSAQWISAGALVERMNFAMALVAGQVASVSLPPPSADSAMVLLSVRAESVRLLGEPLAPASQSALTRYLQAHPPTGANQIDALILGSPDFQKR